MGFQRRRRMWMVWLGIPLGAIGVAFMLFVPEPRGLIAGICAIAAATLLVCGYQLFGDP